MTISPKYHSENARLHENRAYGSSGHYWLGHVLELADLVNARSLIDYGAGKGTLGKYVERYGIEYRPYDPVTFPKKPTRAADLLVALDVLEHIEPNHLPGVLEEMLSFTGKLMFCVVSTRPAGKTLSDGRNAHLIVEDYEWWKKQLDTATRWRGVRTRQGHDHFSYVGTPRVRPIPSNQIKTLRGEL